MASALVPFEIVSSNFVYDVMVPIGTWIPSLNKNGQPSFLGLIRRQRKTGPAVRWRALGLNALKFCMEALGTQRYEGVWVCRRV